MSRETSEWVMMRCKAVMASLFIVVIPPPKPNWAVMAVPETPLQTSISISWPPITVTPIRPIIPPSLQFKSLWFHMVNIISRSSSDHYLQYHADLWIARIITGIFEAPTGRNSALVINFIKGRYFLWRIPCFCCESNIDSIGSY